MLWNFIEVQSMDLILYVVQVNIFFTLTVFKEKLDVRCISNYFKLLSPIFYVHGPVGYSNTFIIPTFWHIFASLAPINLLRSMHPPVHTKERRADKEGSHTCYKIGNMDTVSNSGTILFIMSEWFLATSCLSLIWYLSIGRTYFRLVEHRALPQVPHPVSESIYLCDLQ